MKLTKENVYVDLQGKTKEELTDLYWLLKKNNEEILNDVLHIFIRCYLDLKNKDYKFHFIGNCWSCANSKGCNSKKEVTIEQLKEILQPMGTFTPIAMKCTQEQFDAVKPKLKGCCFANEEFKNYYILTNNNQGIKNLISFIQKDSGYNENREIHEEWDEEIFLKACGIEKEQTLEQRLEKAEAELKRLKEAIEDIEIKIGDWVIINEEELIFKVNDYDVKYLDSKHKKIQDQDLIIKLNELIK